jgi:hypothetical protein
MAPRRFDDFRHFLQQHDETLGPASQQGEEPNPADRNRDGYKARQEDQSDCLAHFVGHPNPIELQRHKVYELVNQQSGQQGGEQAKLEHRDQSKPGQNLGGQLEFEAIH